MNKVIDWKLADERTDGDHELAKELLQILIASIPKHLKEIDQYHSHHNLEKLLASVHKLHGATCYCGTPKLKNAANKLETAIKSNKTEKIDSLCKQLHDEMNAVLTAYKKI
jgi:two-component system, NarL family, sensor histidine kinase BarA